jgi:hypothetical protein
MEKIRMKTFKPSGNFVVLTMDKVFDVERKKRRRSFFKMPVALKIAQCSLSAGGVLLGLVNLVKLYSMVFANVACH